MGKQMSSGSDLTLPIIVGVAIVAVTAVLAKLFLFTKGRKNKSLVALHEGIKIPMKLFDIVRISHDTRIFRFSLPSPEHILGLPIGQHVFLSARINGNLVVRPYTPVSSDEDKGIMDLLVKVYFKDVHPKFPAGGLMSQHLNDLGLGNTVDVRGPSGLLTYEGLGISKIRPNKKTEPEIKITSQLSMIAGGTGLTPMMQIIRYALSLPGDRTEMKLIYANQTPDDILLRDELDKLAEDNPTRFSVRYTVDRPTEEWKHSVGFINAEMISEYLFPASSDNLVMMCGPPPMLKFACNPALDELGFSKENRFEF